MEDKKEMTLRMMMARKTVMEELGEKYHERIQTYTDVIKEYQDANQLEVLPSLLQLLSTKNPEEWAKLMFLAAAAEMIVSEK